MAGIIPKEFIQELLSRIDIIELIDNRLPLKKKSNNNYFACCPFHDEKSASFSVAHNKQFYHCFGCGAHGNAIDFLIEYDRLNFPEAIEALAKIAGVTVPRSSENNTKPAIAPDLYSLLEKTNNFYQAKLRETPDAINYLKQRGISGEIARDFGIGFAPDGWETLTKFLGTTDLLRKQLAEVGMITQKDDGRCHDRFRKRILFPIHDKRNRVIGFGGRIIGSGEPKYLNSPETPLFHKGRELYGLNHILKTHRAIPQILIVEGYMDVIALFQHGINYSVATLGTATTTNHLEELFRHTQKIIFCFDGDKAGRSAAARALQTALPLLQDGRTVNFLFLPDGEDPDTLIRQTSSDEFTQLIENAMPLSKFFFQSINRQVDTSSIDSRARFASIAMAQIEIIPDGIFKKMMIDELTKRVRMNISSLPTKSSQQTNSKTQATSPLTPIRLVIILLIQKPDLIDQINPAIPTLNQPGGELLQKLINLLTTQPNITTGQLHEYWRDQPEAALIAKLASFKLSIPNEGIKGEFIGATKRLRKTAHEQSIAKLLTKAAETSLTNDEKSSLSKLISELHTESTEAN